MKIAVLGLRSIGTPGSGGIEKAVEELAVRHVAAGHDVTVFCRARYAKDAGPVFRGVKIRALPAIYTKHLEAISNTVVAIGHALTGYDIVHVNATGPALLSFMPRLFGSKVVVTVHGLDWKREKWGGFASATLRFGAWASGAFPDRTIVVSKTLLRHYRDTYRRVVNYIPNGVSLPPASGAAPESIGLVPGEYVLFLSRLVPEKGCHTLIEAFRRLDTQKKLVIVGDHSHSEDYAANLQRLADGDPRIVFMGPLYGDAKDAAYRGACLFVLPSTIEGMALVLLEALSYGKGCLCSDIDENVEVIDPSFDAPGAEIAPVAERFRTGDVADLARALDALLKDPARVAALGAAGRSHVERAFNWDRIARQYLEVYEETMQRSG